MGSAKFIDNSGKFRAKVLVGVRTALLDAGSDLLLMAKVKAPYRDGVLRKDTDVEPLRADAVRVHFNVEYASYQERGKRKDGSRIVKRYTTAGTGAHFLENAGKKLRPKMGIYFKKYLGGSF